MKEIIGIIQAEKAMTAELDYHDIRYVDGQEFVDTVVEAVHETIDEDYYTKEQTDSEIETAIEGVVNDAPAPYNTLKGVSDWIEQHEEDAAAMAEDIQQNTDDIAANTSAIATNTENIATNTADISTNTQNIAENAENIALNTQAILQQAQAIAGKSTVTIEDLLEEGVKVATLIIDGTSYNVLVPESGLSGQDVTEAEYEAMEEAGEIEEGVDYYVSTDEVYEIDASQIGYGDSDVDTELTELNSKLNKVITEVTHITGINISSAGGRMTKVISYDFPSVPKLVIAQVRYATSIFIINLDNVRQNGFTVRFTNDTAITNAELDVQWVAYL